MTQVYTQFIVLLSSNDILGAFAKLQNAAISLDSYTTHKTHEHFLRKFSTNNLSVFFILTYILNYIFKT